MRAAAIAFVLMLSARSGMCQTSKVRIVDRLDLERFADSAFADHMRQSAEPSLAVIVVRGDSVLLAKGYGVATDSTPVSPDSTVFHIASISKLFVVAAVMHLVADGSLELDDPISNLLPDMGVPATITLRHLLTHTSGVDEPFLPAVVDDPRKLQPLSVYFTRHPPRFSRPPGREVRYSNYGMALAAHIVERVTNEQFDSYVERSIFGPLRMNSSSIRQPAPNGIDRRMATAGAGRLANYNALYPAGAIAVRGAKKKVGRVTSGLSLHG